MHLISYEIQSSSNQSNETIGVASAPVIHIKSNPPQINQKKHLEMQMHFYFTKFLSCIVVRQHTTPSKIKSFSNFFAKVTQNLSRSVNKHSKYHYPSAKCDSYKVKSSSNQSTETFGNANTLLFHKFSSCNVIRQQIATLDSSFQGFGPVSKIHTARASAGANTP